jgi:hypothetical protein
MLSMNLQQRIVNYLNDELSQIFKNTDIDKSIRKTLASKLVETAIEFKPGKSDRELITIKDRGKKHPPEIIHYNPMAATGLVASLVGGVLGASSWPLLGCAVVGCGAALQGIRSQISPAEGMLFWVISNSEDNCATREEARQLFNEACKDCAGVTNEDFTSALQSLIRLGFIKELDGKNCVVERIYRLNTAHIYEN